MKTKRPVAFNPTITISGTLDGREVAHERTDCHRKGKAIAESWRGSGLAVVVLESDATICPITHPAGAT